VANSPESGPGFALASIVAGHGPAGERVEALSELLSAWRFHGDRALLSRLLELLERHPLPAQPQVDAPLLAPGATVEDNRLAWACLHLADRGRWVRQMERRQWQASRFRGQAGPDLDAAAAWGELLSPMPWAGRARWERDQLAAVLRVARAVAMSAPGEGLGAFFLDDVRESFFPRLAVGGNSGREERLDLAFRTLETGGDGPIACYVGLLPPTSMGHLCRGAVLRPASRRTLRLYLGHPAGAEAQRYLLWSQLLAEPDRLVPFCDLQLARQLLYAWKRGTGWKMGKIEGRNLSALTGRLRAVAIRLAASDDVLFERVLGAVLALPALAARTRVAVARQTWSWCWEVCHRGGDVELLHTTTAPCLGDDPTPGPLEWGEHGALLRTWLCKVALRMEPRILDRWVEDHDSHRQDSTLNRLLLELPAQLVDASGPMKRRSYHRLRALLAWLGPRPWVEVAEVFQPVADLDPTARGLPGKLAAAVAGSWHPAIGLPRGGLPRGVRRFRGLSDWIEGERRRDERP